MVKSVLMADAIQQIERSLIRAIRKIDVAKGFVESKRLPESELSEALQALREYQKADKAITLLQSLEEQSGLTVSQEPIGYITENSMNRLILDGATVSVFSPLVKKTNSPVYTHPQKRLTNDEIQDLIQECSGPDDDPYFLKMKFARLIEKALGITQ